MLIRFKYEIFDFREPIHNLCLGAMLMFRKIKKEKAVFTVACEAIYWIAADNGMFTYVLYTTDLKKNWFIGIV